MFTKKLVAKGYHLEPDYLVICNCKSGTSNSTCNNKIFVVFNSWYVNCFQTIKCIISWYNIFSFIFHHTSCLWLFVVWCAFNIIFVLIPFVLNFNYIRYFIRLNISQLKINMVLQNNSINFYNIIVTLF